MDMNGLTTVPMFFFSPVSDSSLAYSNILAEWLSPAKHNRVYVPEEPFIHGALLRGGRLKSFSSLGLETVTKEYRQPCVVFTGLYLCVIKSICRLIIIFVSGRSSQSQMWRCCSLPGVVGIKQQQSDRVHWTQHQLSASSGSISAHVHESCPLSHWHCSKLCPDQETVDWCQAQEPHHPSKIQSTSSISS